MNFSFGEAPIFYWLFTLLIVIGGGVVLLPGFPLIRAILWSQVLNGMLLPVVLIFMVLLINRPALMKDWTNTRAYNVVAWSAVGLMVALTLALMVISVRALFD